MSGSVRALIVLVALSLGSCGDKGAETSTGTETDGETTAGPTSSTTLTSSDSSDPTTTSDPSTTAPETTDPSGTETGTDTGTTDTDATDTDTDTDATTDGLGCKPIDCGGKIYECGDCLDNDDDGLVDFADPECISPCDDKEATFATGLPGDNMDACNQDCFFDGNSGSGDDKCVWNLKCDMNNPGGDDCPYDPDFKNCPEEQDAMCAESCQVPNGCDCFGCCTVLYMGMNVDIYIGDEDCSLAEIELCQTCTKNEDCDDDCDPEMCEVCFGQDPDDLPPECDGGECEEGKQACEVYAMGGSDCPDGFFCFVGCCEQIIG